jgi:hypothetical protein
MISGTFWAAALLTNLTQVVGFLVLRIDAAFYAGSAGCVVVVVLGVFLLIRLGTPSAEAVETKAGAL